MKIIPYKIEATNSTRYEFESVGPKGIIKKCVEITALKRKNTFNIGFGDMRSDSTIDDKSETNNKDLIRVFATVLAIMKDFMLNNPTAILYFSGSTDQRTAIYHYILKRNFTFINNEYSITGILLVDGIPYEVVFDPTADSPFLAFLIKKK